MARSEAKKAAQRAAQIERVMQRRLQAERTMDGAPEMLTEAGKERAAARLARYRAQVNRS